MSLCNGEVSVLSVNYGSAGPKTWLGAWWVDVGSVVWPPHRVKVICEDCNDGAELGWVLVAVVGVMTCERE